MPITEYKSKPFEVSCDECGDELGAADYGGAMLFETVEEAKERAREWGWRVNGGVVTCEGCQEEEAVPS